MFEKTGVVNLPGLRKSIRRARIALERRRTNSDSAAAASPVLSGKRKRTVSVSPEEGEPQAKKMAAEKVFLMPWQTCKPVWAN